MPGFNEIWCDRPTVRLGRLERSIEVHGDRMVYRVASTPPLRVADFRAVDATSPVSQVAVRTMDIAIRRIVNPQMLHPAYRDDTNPHDEFVTDREWSPQGFRMQLRSDVFRPVGIWPIAIPSWGGVEQELSTLMEGFGGGNQFVPDDLSLIMEIINVELHGWNPFQPEPQQAPRKRVTVWEGKRAIRLG